MNPLQKPYRIWGFFKNVRKMCENFFRDENVLEKIISEKIFEYLSRSEISQTFEKSYLENR